MCPGRTSTFLCKTFMAGCIQERLLDLAWERDVECVCESVAVMTRRGLPPPPSPLPCGVMSGAVWVLVDLVRQDLGRCWRIEDVHSVVVVDGPVVWKMGWTGKLQGTLCGLVITIPPDTTMYNLLHRKFQEAVATEDPNMIWLTTRVWWRTPDQTAAVEAWAHMSPLRKAWIYGVGRACVL